VGKLLQSVECETGCVECETGCVECETGCVECSGCFSDAEGLGLCMGMLGRLCKVLGMQEDMII
jgi:hypothetical protein